MTKKHFIALADMIKQAQDTPYYFNDQQIMLIANLCSAENAMFNRERWYDYIEGVCGKSGGKVKQTA